MKPIYYVVSRLFNEVSKPFLIYSEAELYLSKKDAFEDCVIVISLEGKK